MRESLRRLVLPQPHGWGLVRPRWGVDPFPQAVCCCRLTRQATSVAGEPILGLLNETTVYLNLFVSFTRSPGCCTKKRRHMSHWSERDLELLIPSLL